MKARLRRLLNRLLDRHDDGTPHTYAEVRLGPHACDSVSYCRHNLIVCPCGRWKINRRRAQAAPKQVFNVKDYGAKSDGSTDDTAAIQAAIDAAAAADARPRDPRTR